VRIIKVAMNVGYGGWITPDGELIPVHDYGHGYEARAILRRTSPELLDEFGDFREDLGANLGEDEEATNYIMDRGYVHVKYSPFLEIDFRNSVAPKVKKRMFELINNDETGEISIYSDRGDIRRTNKLDARRFLHEKCP
jgi:hypothetical protein